MLKIFSLLVCMGIVVALGMAIDSQSRGLLGPMNASVPAATDPLARPMPASHRPTVIFAPGRIEGATPEIELRPEMPGLVAELAVAEGDFVEHGQLLMRLEDDTYRHRIALAEAEVQLAEAQLERLINGAHEQDRREAAALLRAKETELKTARLNWNRTDRLHKANVIAQQQADDQTSLVESLTAQVAAARARLELLEAPARADEVRISQARIAAAKAQAELAKAEFDKTRLRAPTRGQVLQINVEEGELTSQDSVEPTIIFVNTSRYQVRAFVEELDAPSVRVGMPVTVVADGMPGTQLTGRVTRLSPRMGRKELWSDRPNERYDTKTREVWIELDTTDALVIGLRVDAIIELDAAVAPSSNASQLAAMNKPPLSRQDQE